MITSTFTVTCDICSTDRTMIAPYMISDEDQIQYVRGELGWSDIIIKNAFGGRVFAEKLICNECAEDINGKFKTEREMKEAKVSNV